VDVTVHFWQAVAPLLSQIAGVDAALKVMEPRPTV